MASKGRCCDAPNIQDDDCGTQDVLVCRSCGQTFPRDQPLDYSEVEQVGEQVSGTYKRPIEPSRLLYRKKCRHMCKRACEELTLAAEHQKCARIVEEAVGRMQGITLKACIYGVAYLLGRKLRYSLTLKQVARISGVAYDKIGQAVLRLKAIYKELQDDEEDQTTVFEQRSQKLLEQMEVGANDEERVLIVRKSSKVYQIMSMLRKYLTISGGNNFVLAATIIGIESFNKKHIPASKMRSYCFKTNGVQNNEIASLVFDMKKELHEIAQCIPWVKDKIDEKPKNAYRTKIWTMFKFIDTIYNYRQLYTVKEKVDLECSYPHCLFKTGLDECKRRQMILEKLQKEMNCEPPPIDDKTYLWPYLSNRKQREKLAEIQQKGSCNLDNEETMVSCDLDDEEAVVSCDLNDEEAVVSCGLNNEEAIVEHITHDTVVENVVMEDDILCDDMWNSDTTQDTNYSDSTATIDNTQYVIHDNGSCDLQNTSLQHSQDTNQDIIESPQYVIQSNSSFDLQDTTGHVQDTNKEPLSDQEVEDCIRELIQRGVSTERILTGDLKDMLAGQFIHFLPPCSSLYKDGGPAELTTDDMSDDELLSYIKTEEEVSAAATSHDQGPST